MYTRSKQMKTLIMENDFKSVNINLICQTFEKISKRQTSVTQFSRFKNNISKVASIVQEFDAGIE